MIDGRTIVSHDIYLLNVNRTTFFKCVVWIFVVDMGNIVGQGIVMDVFLNYASDNCVIYNARMFRWEEWQASSQSQDQMVLRSGME
jgi:hypothetical protein